MNLVAFAIGGFWSSMVFERRGYHVVQFTLFGAALGAWPWS